MTPTPFRIIAIALALAIAVAVGPAASQQPAPAAASSSSGSVTQQELDSLLAPIALYPDSLIAQILMASTYPLEVVLAARWSKEHPGVKGKPLEDAMQKQGWDESVKALTAVPQVLKQMSDKLAWMQKLGDAFLGDPNGVRSTIQSLRAKAVAAGNLKSTPEQTVRTEVVENQTVYIIEPAQQETIYVPTYDPYTVYGSWWWGYPPYSMYPPGYYYPPGLGFAAGIIVGAAIWGGISWNGSNFVQIDHHKYNNFNRSNIGNGAGSGNWSHRVDHRKGVAYGDNKVAQKYNRGGNSQAIQSREQFRARADQGRAQMRTMDSGQLQGLGGGDRASTRQSGGGDFGGRSPCASTRDSGSRGSGFSGANYGSSTREASSRGGSSRSSMSGGARAGGGARGGGGRR